MGLTDLGPRGMGFKDPGPRGMGLKDPGLKDLGPRVDLRGPINTTLY